MAPSSDPIVMVSSSTITPGAANAVPNSPLIFLDNSLILPNDQPDILQQALEAALPSSTIQTTSTGTPMVTTKGKENFVTVFDSRDGTLRLTQDNARALGIGRKSLKSFNKLLSNRK